MSGLATLAIVFAVLVGLTNILFGGTAAMVLGGVAFVTFGALFWKTRN